MSTSVTGSDPASPACEDQSLCTNCREQGHTNTDCPYPTRTPGTVNQPYGALDILKILTADNPHLNNKSYRKAMMLMEIELRSGTTNNVASDDVMTVFHEDKHMETLRKRAPITWRAINQLVACGVHHEIAEALLKVTMHDAHDAIMEYDTIRLFVEVSDTVTRLFPAMIPALDRLKYSHCYAAVGMIHGLPLQIAAVLTWLA
ncbi:hypothetical protein NX059_012444 [Plenodomus lindquistii]|nr:hypothetical protein NX059_012444 [Plenodomus lindquistii]